MPIPSVTLTPAQFTFLQQNLSDQFDQQETVTDLALSGLQYVVLLQTIAPEVDLVLPFNGHFLGQEGFESTSNYVSVVASLNNHVINRGTTLEPGDTPSDRLNRWLSDNAVLVTSTYATLSSGASYIIDPSNIAP
jgi:hypothetical protein